MHIFTPEALFYVNPQQMILQYKVEKLYVNSVINVINCLWQPLIFYSSTVYRLATSSSPLNKT